MGNIVARDHSSDNSFDMDDEELDRAIERDAAEYNEQRMEDTFNDNQLAAILRQLISSGEIMILNSEQYYPTPLPVIRKQPDLTKLKRSPIYESTMNASGNIKNQRRAERKQEAGYSLVSMLANRQSGYKGGPFVPRDLRKISNYFLPNKKVYNIYNCTSKAFCGQFSRDGRQFIAASQDTHIRIFDATTSSYRFERSIDAKSVSWSILDIDFSPDGEHFVYSTWADALFVSRMDNSTIDCLYLQPENQKLGVFSVAYSNCGKHILCGANDGCLYAYDLEANRRTLMAPASVEQADVNAVGFIDETSNVFFSGTDKGIIKLWDRRCLNEANPEPAGLLAGHRDGITYIDSRNDGRYIISNSKDQSIKLWDVRDFSPASAEQLNSGACMRKWDYRWDEVPKKYYNSMKPLYGDTSVMTYRGHRVQKSLIRAKFSPAATTGQRYIYTGCGTGRLVIYDVLTGNIVQAIEGHRDIVRDVAWHPHRPEIVTCSWDFRINLHCYQSKSEQETAQEQYTEARTRTHDSDDEADAPNPPKRRSKRLADRARNQI